LEAIPAGSIPGRCSWLRRHGCRNNDGRAVDLTPTYPWSIGGYTFPGYAALYTVILNLVVVVVLTPLCNTLASRGAHLDKTAAADYYA
jgi:hypothetical protein